MTQYRIYSVGRKGQVLGPAHVIEWVDDAEALRQAHRLLTGHDLEVWQAAGFVHRIRPGGAAGSARHHRRQKAIISSPRIDTSVEGAEM